MDSTQKQDWPLTGGPRGTLNKHHRTEYYNARWMDHLYRYTDPDTKKRVYVSEPYHLSPEHFADLQVLASNGWHVELRGGAQHHPECIRILVWQEGA